MSLSSRKSQTQMHSVKKKVTFSSPPNCSIMSQSMETNQGTENPVVIETVVLDSDIGDTGKNGGENGDTTDVSEGAIPGGNCSSCQCRPPPPFLKKIYKIMENEELKSIVSWSSSGASFVIWNPHLFTANILPEYFRHNNFQSFVCQLNSYGFRKISWENCEYKNQYFRKGEPHLMVNIKRRPKMDPPTEINKSSRIDADKELGVLNKECDLLKVEMTKLNEKQVVLKEKLDSLKKQDELKMMMLVAQRILLKKRELSDKKELKPVDEEGEISEKGLQRKRKIVEANLDATGSNVSMEDTLKLIAEFFTHEGKMELDDEEVWFKCLMGESSD